MLPTSHPTHAALLEHPADILAFAALHTPNCALVILTGTEGGGVRAPGAMMAVTAAGDVAGYVSGGCVDADICARAQAALHDREASVTLRYGAGSPYFDLPLPCGGALEVMICPAPPRALLESVCEALQGRRSAGLLLTRGGELRAAEPAQTGWVDAGFAMAMRPGLQLRLAGRGADLVALARLGAAAGMAVHVETPDDTCLQQVRAAGVSRVQRLTTPADITANKDDGHTAFVLLFHDLNWDVALLSDALAGQAFYVGAVGSARTQSRRRGELAAAGVPRERLQRLRGPVGLIASMRDASTLAVSVLGEIIAADQSRSQLPQSNRQSGPSTRAEPAPQRRLDSLAGGAVERGLGG